MKQDQSWTDQHARAWFIMNLHREHNSVTEWHRGQKQRSSLFFFFWQEHKQSIPRDRK